MKELLKFNGKWRKYQQRVLDCLQGHLADNKIHIVAAPGAGKTTLGIEVIARINKPTIILAPTITIRNQWKQRIIDAFLSENKDIISTNIKEPNFITIITYQALLASFCGKEENEEELIEEDNEDKKTLSRFNKEKASEIISILKNAKIEILCFDEAHHLRNEWWKALTHLMEELKPSQTISLTATPPYDSDITEWERYESLCGEIDEVISIPELVQNNDLCPHQDFIHFSFLRKNETEEINKRLSKKTEFINSILENEELAQIIIKHIETSTDEDILEEPKTYISMASYLNSKQNDIPTNLLELIDIKKSEIPSFNNELQKLFLSNLFVKNKEQFCKENEELITELYNKAKVYGLIFNKSVYLNDNPKIKKQIANSLGKLDSIKEIVEIEHNSLKKNLRMVILTDYIKYDVMDCSALGVIPIWQTIKEQKDISLCVLTGSVILLHKNLEQILVDKLKNKTLEEDIKISEFDRDTNYIRITAKNNKRSYLVELITQIFNEGHINIIVGTQALLGEGWDAPCINSLILSSTVSSYMLSNQMRGRAIRKDRNNPEKIANIWHLASIKILSDLEILKSILPSATKNEEEEQIQIFDYLQLKERFKGYEAPSIKEPHYIENGIERIIPDVYNNILEFNLGKIKETDFKGINSYMKANAQNRNRTKELWEKGLTKAYNAPEKSLRSGVNTTEKMEQFYYRGGYFYMLFLALAFFGNFAYLAVNTKSIDMAIFFIFCFIATMARPTYKYLRCSSPEKIMRQIGIVILETLYSMGEIKTSLQNINIQCKENKADKSIFFSIKNLSPAENNLLIKCMREFLDPIENPRYILIRKGLLKYIKTTDYHAIPSIISQNKKNISTFQLLWKKYIGKCDVKYTRTKGGRKLLIKARKEAFSDLLRTSKTKKLSRFE